jgi:hypothetical protein
MTLSIELAGATFTKYIDQQIPNIALATGYWLFGVDQATSFANLAPNAPVATQVITGTPVYGDNTVSLNPANFFNTGITPVASDPYTYIVVSDFSRLNSTFIGTWSPTVSAHALMRLSTTKLVHGTANSGFEATTNDITPNTMQFAAVTRSATGRATFLNNGSGLIETDNAAIAGGPSSPVFLNPGGYGSGTDLTPTKYAAAMLFPVALTPAQVTSLYTYLKFKLGRRGVVVA